MNLKTPIGRLRFFAILEGISYLLFAVTMPLKHMLDITAPNYFVGMAHGFLFVGYVVFALQCAFVFKWKFKTIVYAMAASIVPFGTFIADKQLFKKIEVSMAD